MKKIILLTAAAILASFSHCQAAALWVTNDIAVPSDGSFLDLVSETALGHTDGPFASVAYGGVYLYTYPDDQQFLWWGDDNNGNVVTGYEAGEVPIPAGATGVTLTDFVTPPAFTIDSVPEPTTNVFFCLAAMLLWTISRLNSSRQTS